MDADIERMRREYAERERRFIESDRYSLYNPAALFLFQERQRITLEILRRHKYEPIDGNQILEVGCGKGDILREFLCYGAHPHHLFGAELLTERVKKAHENLPFLRLVCADGQNLPYPEESFDLVLQYTVFSSVLDNRIRANLAGEMLRVVKHSGMILWYDFWINPINSQTRGIPKGEIRNLFPGCQLDIRRLTLAPPLARRLLPLSRMLADLLTRTGLFNTHYLVAIRRN